MSLSTASPKTLVMAMAGGVVSTTRVWLAMLLTPVGPVTVAVAARLPLATGVKVPLMGVAVPVSRLHWPCALASTR